MSPRHGYLILIPLALFVTAVFVLALSAKPKPFDPLAQYAPCAEVTSGPSLLVFCSNRRAYLKQDGAWTDIGPTSKPASLIPYSG